MSRQLRIVILHYLVILDVIVSNYIKKKRNNLSTQESKPERRDARKLLLNFSPTRRSSSLVDLFSIRVPGNGLLGELFAFAKQSGRTSLYQFWRGTVPFLYVRACVFNLKISRFILHLFQQVWCIFDKL